MLQDKETNHRVIVGKDFYEPQGIDPQVRVWVCGCVLGRLLCSAGGSEAVGGALLQLAVAVCGAAGGAAPAAWPPACLTGCSSS